MAAGSSHRDDNMKLQIRKAVPCNFANLSNFASQPKIPISFATKSKPAETRPIERVPHVPDIVTLTINPAIDIFVNVPRIKPTRKLRCSAPKRDPGGGGINVARVAHVSAATLWRFTRQAAQSENCCTGSWSVRTSIAL